MKRRIVFLSALLWTAGLPRGQAALLQTQTSLGFAPASPVRVVGCILQPLSAFSNPTSAAPSLSSLWSASPPAPAPEAPAIATLAQDSLTAAKPLRLIITGPPGSGKGTYSEKIAAEYGMPHISVGELLRVYAQVHPEVAAVMAAGKLVDAQLVLDVVRQRLSQPDVGEHGFLLDGFPRRDEEAAALQEMLGAAGVDGVIELDVPEAELQRRILARGRSDDRADVFQERMKIYREQTVPAVERFKNAAPVLAPDVSGADTAVNYARVKAALDGLLNELLGR
jgi:adenylate kinase